MPGTDWVNGLCGLPSCFEGTAVSLSIWPVLSRKARLREGWGDYRWLFWLLPERIWGNQGFCKKHVWARKHCKPRLLGKEEEITESCKRDPANPWCGNSGAIAWNRSLMVTLLYTLDIIILHLRQNYGQVRDFPFPLLGRKRWRRKVEVGDGVEGR